MQGIPHYLIDCLNPDEEFNVAIFQDMAKKAILEIEKNGHIPIIVGGTAFYIQALLYGIDLDNKQEKWLEKISNYKKTVFSQMMLAFSTRTHYMNMNMGIKVRLSILLGNR